jgi:hypothetical protein
VIYNFAALKWFLDEVMLGSAWMDWRNSFGLEETGMPADAWHQ